ncbi:MAG: 4Fe-4S binding protein [Pseudomonadales bacterium]
MLLNNYVFVKHSLPFAIVLILIAQCLQASADDANLLSDLLQKNSPAELFPDSDEIRAIAGTPSAAPVYQAGKRIGFLFLNSAVVNAVGYSGKPIHVLVGVDNDGTIRVARLIAHHEPIVLVGIPEAKITALIDGYIGLNVVSYLQAAAKDQRFDAISGATVTVRVIDDSIVRSSIKVARAYGLGGMQATVEGPKATIDSSQSEIKDWTDLIAEQAVTRLKLHASDVHKAFKESGDGAADKREQQGEADPMFIDLYAAQVSVPTIGRSLLGDAEFRNLEAALKPGQQAVLLAARGRYSYKGSGYVRGGIFDRFEIAQGDDSIRFRDLHHKRLRKIAADGAPQDLKEVDLFLIPDEAELDPAKPWRLQLLVGRETGRRQKAFVTFNLAYQIPKTYLKFEAKPAKETATATTTEQHANDIAPLWQQLWQEKIWEEAVLLLALAVLTVIFFFQTWLVKRPVLLRRVRIGFLLFTLFGIGFYSTAQLSVVNILTVVNAMVTGFNWEYFLMEPLIFILWGSVATALLFWGRGAFCGWLCPFGALQELLNKLAKWVKVPQFMVPWAVHERLWPLKYIIFLVLFGVSLHSLSLAERLAEVEPFKTVVVLKFIRDWPFVIFALVMLAAGLFIERFYCRYLCPLGAALAIPARMRMFTWLKRYQQCGKPCQVCANQCMVQAIHPEGEINPNECLYCLHCQELYHDDQNCPVVVKKRERRERREATASDKTNELGQEILIKLREER